MKNSLYLNSFIVYGLSAMAEYEAGVKAWKKEFVLNGKIVKTTPARKRNVCEKNLNSIEQLLIGILLNGGFEWNVTAIGIKF